MATSLTSTGVTFPDSTTQTTAATSAGGTLEAVASGALSTGDMVVVNTDGTVSVVSETIDPTPTVGSASVFAAAASNAISAVYDTASNKIVIVYSDNGNSDYGTAIVGTVSGTSISFGSEVVFNAASTSSISSVYDSANQKVVIAYRDNGNSYYGTAIVGTVSGTSISFGSEAFFNTGTTNSTSCCYDSVNQKVVVVYRDVSNSGQGTAAVGTVSGTSISFGTPVVFMSGTLANPSATYDSSNQKVVIAYQDGNNSNYGNAVVGTVSGTSISFGSPVAFQSAILSSTVSAVYDSNAQKVVVSFSDFGEYGYGKSKVGTVSGTSISFGSAVTFKTTEVGSISGAYDSANQKVVIAFSDVGDSSYGKAVVGTVSGTSISFGSPTVFESANSDNIGSAYDPTSQQVVIPYRDLGNSNYGTCVVFKAQEIIRNLTSENFVGVSDGNYSDTDTATILIAGSVSDAQSGLTAGQSYYVQLDGTLSTTPDDPSVFAGTSISSTKLIVQG